MTAEQFGHAMEVLEFQKVVEQIATYTACSLGKQRIEKLAPYPALEQAEHQLAGVEEALRQLYRQGPLPFGGITDIKPHVAKSRIGGVLAPDALLAIANFIYGGRRVRHSLVNDESAAMYPLLTDLGSQLYDARQVEQELRAAITDEATIHDGASPKLRQLRNDKRQTEGRIRQVLDSMIRSQQKLLQEPVITLRGNSYCLPVRVEHKNQVRGIIHDYSSSGATVFIEPAAVVELGHRVQEMTVEEEREIERILQQLSGLVATIADELTANADILAVLDGWSAMASYARSQSCERPVLDPGGVWRLRRARHPLIPQDKAVPMDLSLGETYDMVVITGPNTGGKTVTLKTVGLLTLMGMSGCFIPATEGSQIGWAEGVFVDIGDEQSIEQSLSTFSSHMNNIVSLLEQMKPGSLVLLDELGAGTDPAEGAALAVAILDELHRRGTTVMATTHYAKLKAYGFTAEHVINASVEFDVNTLQPTYRLLVGIPGRSNALAIAKRLGLADRVIEEARDQLESNDLQAENLIEQMESARRETDESRRVIVQERETVQRLRTEWEQRLQAMDLQQQRVLEQATTKAAEILDKAESEADRIIKELRKRQHQTVKDHELVQLKKDLEAAHPSSGDLAGTRERHRRGSHGGELQVGSRIRVLSLNQEGEVVEIYANGKEILAQLGALKMKVKAQEVEVLGPPDQPKSGSGEAAVSRRRLSKSIPLQMDIRGMTVDEAILLIDKYLDDAVMAHVGRVTVIHGKGTGALRDGLRRHFAAHKQIQSWAPGGPGEGGDGATVIEVAL